MAENSKIEWTDHTFNPWEGCTKVSAGCKYCYAEARAKRFGTVEWGDSGKRRRTSPANWKKPLKWNREAKTKGVRYRVFCASLADVFEEKPDQQLEMDQWRADLFRLIQATPNLDWLLLTKRPENARAWFDMLYQDDQYADYIFDSDPDFLDWLWEHDKRSPILNIWIGTSVENQEQADKRIPVLLDIPATVRFLSMEPLLEKVDIEVVTYWDDPSAGIDWVIVGGESGNKARPFDLSWAYSIVNQCRDGGVPVFVKQFGANPTNVPGGYKFVDKKAGNWDEWPGGLQIRQYPRTAH